MYIFAFAELMVGDKYKILGLPELKSGWPQVQKQDIENMTLFDIASNICNPNKAGMNINKEVWKSYLYMGPRSF